MDKHTISQHACERCGKPFKAYPSRLKKGYARFCSTSCYIAHRWNSNGECRNCGQPSSTRFCSLKCQKNFWNKDKSAYSRKKLRMWNRKKELILSLGSKCSRCGLDDPRVLDINHIDRAKKLHAKTGKYSWNRRFKDWEHNKGNIELLCANCHRIHTWEQMGYAAGV
jgi:hypothetical protein